MIASQLSRLSDSAIREDGLPGCDAARARQLREFARGHLKSAEAMHAAQYPGSRERIVQVCDLKEVRKRFTEVTHRNLIFHISPFAGTDAWMRNIHQLLRRFDLFNGRRVISVMTGPDMADAEIVKRQFARHEVEFIEMPNSRQLQERAAFVPLMQRVANASPHEATFYAHAKGVASLGNATGIMYWRNSMYHHLLDDWSLIGECLTRYPIVGTHRRHRYNDHFPDGSTSKWHFAGTFFWFRNDQVFCDHRWQSPDVLSEGAWSVEAWPGRLFDFQDSCCIAFDDNANSYDPNSYRNPIADPEDDAPEPVNLMKVELGGGANPRGEGFINLDKEPGPTVDVVCDFETDRLPFEDDTVSFLYSAHCIEHIDYRHLLKEIVRVAHIGARVEIVVPYWLHPSAMCQDHKHTVSEDQVENHWMQFLDYYWTGCRKRLFHQSTVRRASPLFAEAKALFPHLSDEQVMRFIPGACGEVLFALTVVSHEAKS